MSRTNLSPPTSWFPLPCRAARRGSISRHAFLRAPAGSGAGGHAVDGQPVERLAAPDAPHRTHHPALPTSSRLGEPVSRYTANEIGDSNGRVVWEGKADIPAWQPNSTAKTKLPLPRCAGQRRTRPVHAARTPGDGTQAYGAASVQMVLRTDLAPTVSGAGRPGSPCRFAPTPTPHRATASDSTCWRGTTTSLARPPPMRMASPGFRSRCYVARARSLPRCYTRRGAGRLRRARPDLGRVRPVRSRGGGPSASGADGLLYLARPRHLPAGRDRAGDGAAARQRRDGRSTSPPA